MSDWEVARQQVVIGGRLVDQNNSPVAFATVTLTSFPETLTRTITAASTDRLRTATRGDGHFCFFNLPDGDYTIAADWHSQRIEKTTTVKRDSQGNFHVDLLDLTFSSGG